MTNQLIRNIQIDLILGNSNPIIKWFNDVWDDLSLIEENVYHTDGKELIYFNSKKEWIFFRDDKNDILWCNYERYWSVFREKFTTLNYTKLNYTNIQGITKFLIEEALNNNLVISEIDFLNSPSKIEKALANSVTTLLATPSRTNQYFETVIEETLYKNIAAPLYSNDYINTSIKEALNNRNGEV